MLLFSAPTFSFTLSSNRGLPNLDAPSRFYFGAENNTLGLFLRHKYRMTLPSRIRSLKLEATLQIDNHGSSSHRNEDSTIHGISETIVDVLGGGQLGRMLCQTTSLMAIKVVTLDPLEYSPASSLSYQHFVGRFDDGDSVREFSKKCGVLTIEIEHVDAITLKKLEEQGVDCQPKPSTIRIIQMDNPESAEEVANLYGFPMMVKSRRQAYDGRGNAIAHCKEELPSAIAALGGYERDLYVKRWTSFTKELAVIVARGRDGSVLCYPVVETIHKDSICHIVEAPADVPEKIKNSSVDIARRAVSSLEGARVFAVELFLTDDGQVLLNKVAPRPHNSGHHTIESCYTSQYEQHLRAVIGLPLGETSMKTPAAIMYNILGEEEGEQGFYLAHQLMNKALSISGAKVHWYDKPEMRKLRKMGHITLVGPSRSSVKKNLDLMLNRKSIKSNTPDTPQVAIIMGSDSDLPTMKDAAEILDTFHVPYEITIVSAHRTNERMHSFALSAKERGIQIIIAGAGGAAHLPGMVASLIPLPVIGVPIRTSSLDGLDSLLSIVQMPKGTPVATVEIGNAENAALTAVRMLATRNEELCEIVIKHQEELKDTVLKKIESWNEKDEVEDSCALLMNLDLMLNRKSIKSNTPDTPQVAIIMGSDSDLPTMKDAAEILNAFHVPFEITIVSTHQMPERMYSFALSAKERGIQIIIAGAGGAAHLPGTVASLTPLPVIGVPIRTSSLDGVDLLFSIVQTPKGIPVTNVGIENAANAALQAVRFLATRNDQLWERLIKHEEGLKDTTLKKVEKLERKGWEKYLNH